jgi:heat shock factor-binding protein 1
MSRRFLAVLLTLFLLLSVSFAQTTKFKDVPSNHWAASAVKYLTDLGIISGIKPDTFGGDLYVTRYQVAVLLYKLIQALQAGKIALPTADVEELKDLVSQLQDELKLVGANVEDLMSALQDLDSRISDLESAVQEKVSVEDVESMIQESLADVTSRLDDLDSRISDLESAVQEKVSVEDVESMIQESLADVTSRLDDLDSRISDFDTRLSDLESAVQSMEKVEVTPEQIEAVVGEKLEEVVSAKVEEKIGDLEGRVSDLEGFVTDLDSRLADVETALVDKPSLDEVQAMIEEKISEISIPDVEELTGRVSDLEDRVSAVETRLDDVDSAISDLMSTIDEVNANLVDLSDKVEEVLALKDKLDELIKMVESIEGIEVPAELEDIKSFVTDLDAKVSDLAVAIEDLNTLASDLQSQIDNVNARVDELSASLDNINSSIDALSTSVDDLYVLNDGVSTRLDEAVNRLSDLESKVADLEKKGVKPFTLTLTFGAKWDFVTKSISTTPTAISKVVLTLNNLDFGINKLVLTYDNYGYFALDNYGLVGFSAPLSAYVNIAGVKVSAGAGNNAIGGKVSGSMDNINWNIYGMLSINSGAYDFGPVGADISMGVAKGVTVFADAYYNNASFAGLVGTTLDGLLKDTSVTLEAKYVGNKFGAYAEVSTTLMKGLDAGVSVDMSDLSDINKNTVTVTVFGSYKVNERLTLSGYVTNNSGDNNVSKLSLGVSYVPVDNVSLTLGVVKTALPLFTSNPYPDSVNFGTTITF